ncbi:MAG: excinuclease ABC subunit UvrB [Parcubacteria group bacterium]|nr:excinuclease ABC subunit UvrB [Parcubacteria group bacterium]
MFQLHEPYLPTGDQPQAIGKLTAGFSNGKKNQTLLGVTGSGKTFTMAHVISNLKKPTLVISHNKTLAAQLYQEFKQYFPENSVHYFVSYYDYYQPEAYLPHSDTYIEKDSRINEEIDRLRHAATQAILSRDDVIIIASVSCIYNLGSPEDYEKMCMEAFEGQRISLVDFIKNVQKLQYIRDYELKRGTFRNTKDEVEIFSATGNVIYKFKIVKGKIVRIGVAENINQDELEYKRPSFQSLLQVKVFPAKYWITPENKVDIALQNIQTEMQQHTEKLKRQGKGIEAGRLTERTLRDIQMIKQTGYCHGIENYSRHLDFRNAGDPPFSLLDFFKTKKEFLTIIDESHITVPQLRGMYRGDRRRKETLVEYGFRLPSALDNRPLVFEEFEKRIQQTMYVSATPAKYELKKSTKKGLVEQLVRPTGLLDPKIEIVESKNQVVHLIQEIKKRISQNHRVLITTLTKRMAEDLTEYLADAEIKVNYIHSEIKTLDRLEIIRDLRLGTYDVIVGVNLLREGLDLPEVSLVAILDADKEGFLRNATTLIQTMGRAARHDKGHVLMYADKITKSMQAAIDETNRRRKIQEIFNKKHGITPQTIKKAIVDFDLPIKRKVKQLSEDYRVILTESENGNFEQMIDRLKRAMEKSIKQLDFETALIIREQIQRLKKENFAS